MAMLTAAIRNIIGTLQAHAQQNEAQDERVENLLNGLYEQLYKALNQELHALPVAVQKYAEAQVDHLESAMDQALGLLTDLQKA